MKWAEPRNYVRQSYSFQVWAASPASPCFLAMIVPLTTHPPDGGRPVWMLMGSASWRCLYWNLSPEMGTEFYDVRTWLLNDGCNLIP